LPRGRTRDAEPVTEDGESATEVRSAYPATVKRKGERIGFMDGLIEVPDDFDRMGAEEIEKTFGSRT
jgi:hypothetical protein